MLHQRFLSFKIGLQVDGYSNGRDSDSEISVDSIHNSCPHNSPPLYVLGISDSQVKTMSVDRTLLPPNSAQSSMLVMMEESGKLEKSPGSEEKGVGRRKRKSALFPRFEEPDDSNDDELYDPHHDVRKCRKTGGSLKNRERKINGSIRKDKLPASSSVRSRSFLESANRSNCESLASATNSNVIGSNTSFCQRNGGQVMLLQPLNSQSSVGNSSAASSFGIDGKNSTRNSLNDYGADASDVAGTQQLRASHDKQLELEVRNENGEVEIVTIVDLHSSSDEGDLLAMNGEDEIIPLSDNDSCAVSTDHDQQLSMTELNASAGPAESSCSAVVNSKMSFCLSGLDDLSRRINCNSKQNGNESLNTGPATNSRTELTTENKKSISARKKRRKRARVGDDFNQFDSDVGDNDKVNRLKKMYGFQRQNRNVKTNQTQNNCDKTAVSSSLGPYIHVNGPRDAPTQCKVINVKDVDLDAPTKSKKNQLLIEAFCVPSSIKLLDFVPWLCVFCGNGSAHSNLGDLFGPYYPQSVKSESTDETQVISDGRNTSTLGKVSRSPRRHSSRLSTGSCDSSLESFSSRTSIPQELWVHESCAVWTSGIYVASGNLQGLEEAASIASQVCCFSCHKMGATLGCYRKGCSQNYHYLCAVKSGCFFQEENFSILCPRHRDRGKKMKVSDECD